MRQREPLTQRMKASQARQEWSSLLERVFRREARVIVENSGVPVAAIISAQDLEQLQQLERARADGWKAIEEIWARNVDKDPDEVEADVAEEIEAMRREERDQRASQRPA